MLSLNSGSGDEILLISLHREGLKSEHHVVLGIIIMRLTHWKARTWYIIAVLFMIILGLGSRRFPEHQPSFVYENAGDALWASMIYFGVRAIAVTQRRSFALAISLLFCFAIEFSQLYQADWINHIRSTLIGSLILGRGFLAADLVRYTAGIIVAYLVDRFIHLSLSKKSK